MTTEISLLAIVLLLNAAVYWFALKVKLLDMLGVLTNYDKRLLKIGISFPILFVNILMFDTIFTGASLY